MSILKSIVIAINESKCFLGFHSWYMYYIRVDMILDGKLDQNNLRVPIRECVNCGKKQHHLMPRYLMSRWKDCDWNDGDDVKLVSG